MSNLNTKKFIELVSNKKHAQNVSYPEDITCCVAIRASEINPWVVTRLKFLLSYYYPRPNFVVVDFGSDEPFSSVVRDICINLNAEYIYENDKGTFSLAKARNIGAQKVKTDFIFFSDLDYIFEKKLFQSLAESATFMEMKHYIRKLILMPIYHISEEYTAYLNTIDEHKIDQELLCLSQDNFGCNFGDVFEFIAPYSNAFLIHKDFFSLSGGYCELFRGHGSEDFEYLIRLAMFSSEIPVPQNLEKDFYGPNKESFYDSQPYMGFRKYLEAFTLASAFQGFKAFHLWHDKPKHVGYWTDSNDWKREKFNLILNTYKKQQNKLLNIDYINRTKKVLCIVQNETWGYFLPLRLYGYKIFLLDSKDDEAINQTIREISSFVYDAVCIFNPYMKSQIAYKSIIELTKKLGIKLIVIERGALPFSIYYSAGLSYDDEDYKDIKNKLEHYECKNEKSILEIMNILKQGNLSVEKMTTYDLTRDLYTPLRLDKRTKILIPLQLTDDVAVNYFGKDNQIYEDFVSDISLAASKYKHLLFIVKKHPLAKNLNLEKYENLVIANEDSNIHAIIDIADIVIVYNSGVGLLSLIHGKPTFNIGNAYYQSDKYLSIKAGSIFEAIKIYFELEICEKNTNKIVSYLDWLIHEKYSWFSATSILKDYKSRKSHQYKNIFVEYISLDGIKKAVGRGNPGNKFSVKSYLSHFMNFSNLSNRAQKTFINKNKLKKLIRDPYLFFKDFFYKHLNLKT